MRGDNMSLDEELRDWLRRSFDGGSSFLKAIAAAALLADAPAYAVLRPALLRLKQLYPEP